MPQHRMVAAAGVGTSALLLIGGVAGNLGRYTSFNPASLTEYYRTYAGAVAVSAYANLLAAVLLAAFGAGLWAVLRTSETEAEGWGLLGAVGGAAAAIVVVTTSAVQLALPVAADLAAPDVVFGFHLLWESLVGVIGVAAAPFLVGFSVAARRRGLLPAWLVWVGLVGAGAGMVYALPVEAFGAPTVASIARELIGSLQYPALFVWLIGAGVVLGRRGVRV